jgi:hypothetical protein
MAGSVTFRTAGRSASGHRVRWRFGPLEIRATFLNIQGNVFSFVTRRRAILRAWQSGLVFASTHARWRLAQGGCLAAARGSRHEGRPAREDASQPRGCRAHAPIMSLGVRAQTDNQLRGPQAVKDIGRCFGMRVIPPLAFTFVVLLAFPAGDA